MDEVAQAVAKLKKEWDESIVQIQEHIRSIESCGTSGRGTEEANSLPRLNGAAQDGLALLRSLQFELDFLAQQLSTEEEAQSAQLTFEFSKEQYQTTKAGMTSAAESTTESVRRTRQLMVQEVERSANTLSTFEESTSVLKQAESEYKGHHSLLIPTRNLLSTMRQQDVLDRVILAVGFLIFSSVVLFVVSKRIGLLKLQRKINCCHQGRFDRTRGWGGVGDGMNNLHSAAQ